MTKFAALACVSATLCSLPPSYAATEPPPTCAEWLLTTETLRCFRAAGDHTTAGGCYAFGAHRESVLYQPYQGQRPTGGWPFDQSTHWREANPSSHMKILKRMMGPERFSEFLRTRDHGLLDHTLDQELAKSQSTEDQLDAEELLAQTEKIPANQPLPVDLENTVFRLFSQMGRLASPMKDWLRPKLEGQRLTQLPSHLLEDPIEREVSQNVLVYKAVLFRMRLHGTREFIMSGSASGLPDQVHDLVIRSVTMAVPKQRLEAATSGYLVIRFVDAQHTRGTIEFVTKGRDKQVLAREDF